MKCDQVIEKIKARVAGVDPAGPRKCLGVFQLSIKAADGTHEWNVDLKKLKVTEGSAAADVTLNVDDETFLQIGAKTLGLDDAISAGKVTVTGDKALVAALVEVLK